jgi:hypothetical protein
MSTPPDQRPLEAVSRALLLALREAVQFIENGDSDSPDCTRQFFAARELWRAAFAAARDAAIILDDDAPCIQRARQ